MLLSELKKLTKHTAIYGIGTFASRSVGFFMLPVYTHFLLPSDYGILELIDLTSFILIFVFSLALDKAVLRFYNLSDTDLDRKSVISSSILLWHIYGLIVLLLILPLAGFFSITVIGSAEYSRLFLIAFINVFLVSSFSLSKTILRAQNRSYVFTLYSLGYTFVAVIFNILFIAILQVGVIGYLYATLIGSAVCGTILVCKLLKEVGFRIDFAIFRQMLRYAIPFIPSSLLLFVLNWSDRYILRLFRDLDEIGLYALGYKIGMVLVFLVVMPFDLIWSSYIFEASKKLDAKRIYTIFSTYFFFVTWLIGLGIAIFAEEIISVMSDPKFYEAHRLVPIIILGMLFMTSIQITRIGILIKGKSKFLPLANGIAAVLNILLNFFLIPKIGMYGAAITTAISFFVCTLLLFLMSQRMYHIEFEYRRIAKIIGIAVGIFAVAYMVTSESLLVNVIIKATLLLSFPIFLMLLRFYSDDEIFIIKKTTAAGLLSLRQRLILWSPWHVSDSDDARPDDD
ncbi:MAG: polysaccharide biosynthesis C-terminal domain-containing protein [Proteobacteria bacterium]|nr:polysaccharide biosynthesis C-terminal domain-containing protein [Pseudomonadota bacterium]